MSNISMDMLLDPDRRDEVVATYKGDKKGGERYGVSCPKCYLRIAPQGREWAEEHQERYCQHAEQYNYEVHETIYEILENHGLPMERGMFLTVKVDMTEATERKKKRVPRRTIGDTQERPEGVPSV